MRSIPAWYWSVASIALIAGSLAFGAGGPEGRALSRTLYPPIVSLVLIATLFAYLQQSLRPTRKLGLINLAAVAVALYVTIPLWHFGVRLRPSPGGPPATLWPVNLLVIVCGVALYRVLVRVTRALRPGTGKEAVEDKQERLTG